MPWQTGDCTVCETAKCESETHLKQESGRRNSLCLSLWLFKSKTLQLHNLEFNITVFSIYVVFRDNPHFHRDVVHY